MRHVRVWLRRIKAAIGMGVTWAVGWAAGLGVITVIAESMGGYAWAPTVGSLLFSMAAAGTMGFVAGASFSVVLGIAERRQTFDQLSIPRFALWGAVGGFALAVVFSLITIGLTAIDMFGAGAVGALLGSGSAAGSLAIARRAEAEDALPPGERPGLIGTRMEADSPAGIEASS